MLNDKGFNVYSQSSKPRVEFFRVNRGSDGVQKKSVASVGLGADGFSYNSPQILSYSFSRSVKALYGEFEIQVKDDYSQEERILDLVQPLDIVEIYEGGGGNASFIGVVQTVSFGATAGAYNKSVFISGSSIGILFEMFTFSTSATSMAFFVNESGNLDLSTALTNGLQENVEKGGRGMEFSRAFKIVYDNFVKYATDKRYSKIATNGIYDIIKTYFGEPDTFVKSNLKFFYQMTKQLYDAEDVNLYSYFSDLLPEQTYEFYEDIQHGKPVLVVREKPFDKADWGTLILSELNPVLITDYTVSKSNAEVYTSFFSILEGSSLSMEFYKAKNAAEQGSPCFVSDEEKLKKYGYRPLIAKFIGYSKEATEKDKNGYLNQTFLELSERMKEWYSRLDEMYTGDITMVALKGENSKRIGTRVRLCGCTFYVTSEKHSWAYGDSPTVNYTIERGGMYTEKGFSPATNISRRFAELLERE